MSPAGRARRAVVGRRAGHALVLALLTVAAACSSAAVTPSHRGRPPATAGTAPGGVAPVAPATAAGARAVTDTAGDRFVVTSTAARQLPVVTVHGALESAAPGHDFLEAELQVTNPTAAPEPIGPFDDPTTGLAGGVDFVMGGADAARLGYGADCGADPAYPATACPISFPQRLTVDADSADTGGPAVVLAPGATAMITCSYGPLPAAVAASAIAVWFAGAPAPVDLTP